MIVARLVSGGENDDTADANGDVDVSGSSLLQQECAVCLEILEVRQRARERVALLVLYWGQLLVCWFIGYVSMFDV